VGFCLVSRRRGREEKTRGQSTLLIYSFSFLPENRAVRRYNHREYETLLAVGPRENKTSFYHNKFNAR
jgi:hypothetical protein